MDKITQELITALIQRIDQLEARISKIEGTTQNYKKNTARGLGQATEGQLSYIKGLEKELQINGEDYSMLSKQETGDYIEKLLAEKNKNSHLRKQRETSAVGNDIQNGVLDNPGETGPKSLTKEEIEEIGEEHSL